MLRVHLVAQALHAHTSDDGGNTQNCRDSNLLLVVGNRLTDLAGLVADQVGGVERNAPDDDVLLVVHFGLL